MMKIIITAIVTAFLVASMVCFHMVKLHHGEMNVRVGHPYRELVEHMHELAAQGNTNELNRLIGEMHDHRIDIFGAWLGGDDDFRQFVRRETGRVPNQEIHGTQ